MLLLVGAGFMLTTAFSTLNSLVQEMAPDALRGRVLSIFGVAFRGGGPVGSLLAGFLVRRAGAPVVMAAYAATLGVIAVVLLRGAPSSTPSSRRAVNARLAARAGEPLLALSGALKLPGMAPQFPRRPSAPRVEACAEATA